MTDCLAPDKLEALHSGRLSDAELEQAASHLETCTQCVAALQRISANQPHDWRLLATAEKSTTLKAAAQLIDRLLASTGIAPEDDFAWTLPHKVQGYTLLDVLGRGGMGVVYRARQHPLERIVAVKVPHRRASPELIQRFLAEAQAVARVDHPGIVPIFEVVSDGDLHFYSMACVDGISLQQRLKAGVPTQKETLRIMREICDAIEHAHRQGLIHRDLKPSNILLTKDGTPKVTDFGLARQIDRQEEMTVAGQILGTPAYMAPEQARGANEAVSARTDVYSLGAVLFCLLTGKPPFSGDKAVEILHQVIHRDAPSPRALMPSVSRDLETVCLKCLEKDPARRYYSAAEVGAELRRVAEGQPILARPISVVGRTARWIRRYPLVAGLAAALIIAALVSVTMASYLADSRKQRLVELTNADQRELSAYHQLAQGLTSEASVAPLRDLLARVTKTAAEYPHELRVQRRTYEVRGMLATLLADLGQINEALSLREKNLQLHEELRQKHPDSVEEVHNHAIGETEIARCLTKMDQLERAQEHAAAALNLFEQSQGATEATLKETDDRAVSEFFNMRANLTVKRGFQTESIELLKEAVTDWRRAIALRKTVSFPTPAEKDKSIADLQGNLCSSLVMVVKQGDPEIAQAVSDLRDYLSMRRKLLERLPIPEHQQDFAMAVQANLRGAIYWNLDLAEHRDAAAQGMREIDSLVQRFPNSPSFHHTRAKLLYQLVWVAAKQEDGNLALARAEMAIRSLGEAFRASPDDTGLIAEIKETERLRRGVLEKFKLPLRPLPFWVAEPESMPKTRLQEEQRLYVLVLKATGFDKEAKEFAELTDTLIEPMDAK